jgi:dienelactone hydrolase
MRNRTRGLGTALLLGCSFLLHGSAWAQEQQRQIGPDPTVMALEANRGPFTINTMVVPASVEGFGGGTIHFPTGTDEGPFGVIAVVPGFVSPQSTIRWWGPRLSSHGFVVITIDTNAGTDNPSSRVGQLRAALDVVIAEGNEPGSPLAGLVDSSKQAVMGWSFGGGAALLSAAGDPTFKAIIPFAPFNGGANNFNTITVPSLIIACQNDNVANVDVHAGRFFGQIPDTTPKAFLEVRGGAHTCANTGNPDMDVLGKVGVAWMKRFMDGDMRYSPFLCGEPHQQDVANPRISGFEETCPF